MLWFEILDWVKDQSLDAEFNFYIERKLGKRWYSRDCDFVGITSCEKLMATTMEAMKNILGA